MFQLLFSQLTDNQIPSYINESIGYDLNYGIFKIGEAQLSFSLNNSCKNAFIVAEAKSTGWVKILKNIHFRYESCMDTITGLPIYDSRILIEGEYKDLNKVYYNHSYKSDSSLLYSKKTDSVIVPKNIYDLLTGFYDFRTNYIYPGMPINYKYHKTTFFIDDIWDLNIYYHGIEKIKTQFGHYNCYVFKPETIVGHFFRTSDAMTIWITKSKQNIPVRFCIELKIGTLYGEITSYIPPARF
jgi:hypothetical protein